MIQRKDYSFCVEVHSFRNECAGTEVCDNTLHLMEGISNVYGSDNIKSIVTVRVFLFQSHYSLIFINTLFCIPCLIKKRCCYYILFYDASKKAPYVCKTV
jgi:hypothetical protein